MADVTDTYYASSAFIGYGAQVMVGQNDGSPETFVAVAEINRIVPGEMTTGVIPVTHLRSPGRHHEKRATIRDSGPIVCEGNYIPTHGSHKQTGGDGFAAERSLLSLWRNVTEANFRLVMPDASSGTLPDGGSPGTGIMLPVRGTITKYQPGEMALEAKMPFTFEITPLQDYSGGLP